MNSVFRSRHEVDSGACPHEPHCALSYCALTAAHVELMVGDAHLKGSDAAQLSPDAGSRHNLYGLATLVFVMT